MRRVIICFACAGAVLLMTGCAGSGAPAPGVYGNVAQALSTCGERDDQKWCTNGYRTDTKAIVGSRQKDAQVVLDAGKVLKVWVAPYTQGTTLVAAHDVYTIVEKPHFVVGEMVPITKRKKRRKYKEDIPFAIKDKYLQTVDANGRSGTSQGGKYDAAIKKYIK